MRFALLLILILTCLSLVGCSGEQALQKELAKPIHYSTYANLDFSIKYPDWPESKDKTDETAVQVSKGYCSVIVKTQQNSADELYKHMIGYLAKNNLTLETNDATLFFKHSGKYANFTFINENRIIGCNNQSHTVTIACIQQAYNQTASIRSKILESAKCSEVTKKITQKVKQEKLDNVGVNQTKYKIFEDKDFEITYPDWHEITGNQTEQVLGVTKGTCTVFVNKYNARPKDLFEWSKLAIKKNDQSLLSSSVNDGVYLLEYTWPYNNQKLKATARSFYCNYLTYSTLFICLDGNEEPKTQVKVLDSAICKKEYAVQEKVTVKEVVKQLPKIKTQVETIKAKIVDTNIGKEFGMDEEVIVFFINNNKFFTKILSDFDRGNLVFEDKANNRELKLKVDFDSSGKITYLGDGQYNDADVTLYLPLKDALNILSNAKNINPLTLLSFAVNVRTKPANIKQNIINNFLKGKYN